MFLSSDIFPEIEIGEVVLRTFLYTSLLTLFFTLSNCTALLYYPTAFQYIDPSKLDLSPEEIVFYSEDQRLLSGWYFESKTPQALVIMFHGNAQNMTAHFLNDLWLLDHNYALFVFDYRGYGRSQGIPTPEGTVLDGKAALYWAQAKAKDLGVPLIVHAQSIGGIIALQSYLQVKEHIDVTLLIIESSFCSYQNVAQNLLANNWFTYLIQHLPYLLLSDEHAPGEHLAKISPTPLLVIHGDEDQVVDVALGKDLFKKAPHPKQLWIIPGGKHINAFWQNSTNQEKLLRIMSKHLNLNVKK